MSEYESALLQTEAPKRAPSNADLQCQFYKRVLTAFAVVAVIAWVITVTVLVIYVMVHYSYEHQIRDINIRLDQVEKWITDLRSCTHC